MSTPSARERTVSLFTGQTDLEAGAALRDGSAPTDGPKPRRKRKGTWLPCGGDWSYATNAGSNGVALASLRARARGFEAFVRGNSIGTFDTLATAALGVEKELGDA